MYWCDTSVTSNIDVKRRILTHQVKWYGLLKTTSLKSQNYSLVKSSEQAKWLLRNKIKLIIFESKIFVFFIFLNLGAFLHITQALFVTPYHYINLEFHRNQTSHMLIPSWLLNILYNNFYVNLCVLSLYIYYIYTYTHILYRYTPL